MISERYSHAPLPRVVQVLRQSCDWDSCLSDFERHVFSVPGEPSNDRGSWKNRNERAWYRDSCSTPEGAIGRLRETAGTKLTRVGCGE